MKPVVVRQPLEERGVSTDLIDRLVAALEFAWASACEVTPDLSNRAMTMWPEVDDAGFVHVSVGEDGAYGRASASTPCWWPRAVRSGD